MRRKIYVIQSDELITPGELLAYNSDIDLVIIEAFRGEVVPRKVDDASLIVLGNRSSVHSSDVDAQQLSLEKTVKGFHARGMPILGICYGAHILARIVDGSVTCNHRNGPEIGYVKISWTEAAKTDPLFGGLPGVDFSGRQLLASSHFDAIEKLPKGAIVLAKSPRYPIHAFRAGRSWGVQFHPEIDFHDLRKRVARQGGASQARLPDMTVKEVAQSMSVSQAILHRFIQVSSL